uniref:Rho GDP-dissociation inhibitor 1 n=1 Tax=Araucaria cunninghamii TaxID=56994 RepID=A0A0D6R8Y2_ARACU
MNGPSQPGDAAGSSESFEQNRFDRQFSTTSFTSLCDTDDERDSDNYVPGPLLPLKEQLERDKEDESLRRWKEQLLGSLDYDFAEDKVEPEVTFLSMEICCDGREINIPLTIEKRTNDISFAIKEGCNLRVKFKFAVHHNIVSGLTWVNTIWRSGIQVEQNRHMFGTFSPKREPYTHCLEEDMIPTGVLARGTFVTKSKFIDDDGRCHLELDYSFDIVKDW